MTGNSSRKFYEALRERNEKRSGSDRFIYAHYFGREGHANLSDLFAELLQNAEDAEAHTFGLRLLSGGLLVWNDGRPFDEKDVAAISGLLVSSKEQDAIGYFGIGFKAVLLVTRMPCVLSGQYRFWLYEGIDPYPLEAPATPEGEPDPPPVPDQARQLAGKYTVFWLPWRNDEVGEEARRRLEEMGPSLTSLLLFLDRLETVELDEAGRWTVKRRKLSGEATELVMSGPDGERRYLRFSWTTRPPQKVVEKVVESLHERDPRRRRWLKAPPRSLFGLALCFDEGGRPKRETGKVFVYFPTLEETGLRFHIQGRMALTGDRKRVRFDDPMSRWALEELRDKARHWPEWFDRMRLFPSVWRVLPGPGEPRERWQGVAEALREALKEGQYFYGDDNQPHTREQVFLAHREELYDLITTDDLREITGQEEARWVHPEMRRSEVKRTVGSLGVQEVKADAIISWLERHTDPEWWENRPLGWLQTLYRYLDAARLPADDLQQIPLVRVQNGCHVRPDEAVFPPEREDEVPETLRGFLNTMPIVHPALAAEFRGLLSRLGTRDFHVEDLVDRFLKRLYTDDQHPTPEENVQHIRLLFALYQDGRILRRKLKDWAHMPILRDTQGNWVRPREAYLPPELGGLPEVMVYLDIAGGRPVVTPGYRQGEEDAEAWRKFLEEELECARLPRATINEEFLEEAWRGEHKTWCTRRDIPDYSVNFDEGRWDKWRWRGLDWEIDGMDTVLRRLEEKPLSVEESRALWVVTAEMRNIKRWAWVEWGNGEIDILLRCTESRVAWFYRSPRKSAPGLALWLKRLRELAWLPDEEGHLHRPDELFAPDLKEVLGTEGFAYLHPEIPLRGYREWARTLGVRLDASVGEVCSALAARFERSCSPEEIGAVYKWLSERADDRAALREVFAEQPLILIPGRGVFKRTEVCWHDPAGVMPSLRDAWRDLHDFFVGTLDVPEEPDADHIARFVQEALQARRDPDSWLKAARAVQRRWDEVSESLRAGLRDARWPGMKGGERVWESPDRLFLPDHRRLVQVFEGRVAWWDLEGLEDLARKLGVRPVSQAEPEVRWSGDLGPREDIGDELARLWEALRWFASAQGKEIPEEPPDIRETAGIRLVYRLEWVRSEPIPRKAVLAHEEHILRISSDLRDRDVGHAVGTALEEGFGVEHLREFLKDIWGIETEDDWRHVMERYAEELGETEWPPLPQASVADVESAPFAVAEPAVRERDIAEEEETPRSMTFSGEVLASSEMRRPPKAQVPEGRERHVPRASRFRGIAVHSSHRGYGARASGGDPEARKDVEEMAMDAAQKWLKKEGFEVENVSKREGLGYDLEARRGNEVRHVEVKGVSRRQPVKMTQNEWEKAGEYGDAYWLFVYVVEEGSRWVLPDPAATIEAQPKERIEIIYVLDDVWKVAQRIT